MQKKLSKHKLKVFDDKKAKECLKRLKIELSVLYEKFGIKDEFKTVDVARFAIASNLNKSGVAKKAVDAIEQLVVKVKGFQEKVETRLLKLEGISLNMGLNTSLRRENINHFLKEYDDVVYENKLKVTIENELKRQAELNAQLTVKAKVSHVEPKKKEEVNTSQILRLHQTVTPQKTDNKEKYIVKAIFEVEVGASMAGQLGEMLINKLKKANLKLLPTKVIVEKYEKNILQNKEKI